MTTIKSSAIQQKDLEVDRTEIQRNSRFLRQPNKLPVFKLTNKRKPAVMVFRTLSVIVFTF